MPRYMLSVFVPDNPGPFGPYESEVEMVAALQATEEFNAKVERSGQLVFADGLTPPALAVTMDGRGEEPVRKQGPFAQSQAHLGGFWVVDTPDAEAAMSLAAEASHACRGIVEVRQFAADPSAQ